MNAVMDTLIERVPDSKRTYTVHYDLLNSNKEGKITRSYKNIAIRQSLGKSVFEKIAWTGNKVKGGRYYQECITKSIYNSRWR